MSDRFTFQVNGVRQEVSVPADTPLLYALRGDLALNGAKYGCGLEQCGSCTVIIDGEAVMSCGLSVAMAAGKSIETLEGIGAAGALHPIQKAILDAQAAQCGYCTAGIIMAAKALLDQNSDPTDDEIKSALRDNLCRCGTYHRVLKAVKAAAVEMRVAKERGVRI